MISVVTFENVYMCSSVKLLQRHRLRLHRRQMRGAKAASRTEENDCSGVNNSYSSEIVDVRYFF